MKLNKLDIYPGPNIYAPRPLIRVLMAGGNSGALTAVEFRHRLERILSPPETLSDALAPLLQDHDEIHWAQAFGALSVVLQDDRSGAPLTCRVRAGRSDHEKMILIECNHPPLGERAVRFAGQLSDKIYDRQWGKGLAGTRARMENDFRSLTRARSAGWLDGNTQLLVDAARKRDIPVMRLATSTNIMTLGQGVNSRRLSQLLSDGTGAVGARVLAHDKLVTAQVLRSAGLPVPRHFRVRTEAEINHAVAQLGFPLVVKGSTVNHGASVTTGVMSEEALRTAIRKVQQFNSAVMIEQQIEGNDYRLTIVDGRLAAAARRNPAQVTGDSQKSIRTLVVEENRRRQEPGPYAGWLRPLQLDEEAISMLAGQGHRPDSVPRAGEKVFLRSVANVSRGGHAEDVTDLVHPDIERMALRAARLVGLDMAGVDVLTTDITRPLALTGGAILEVNLWPGITLHYNTPTPPRDVAGTVIDYLFPHKDRGRIPTIAVTGTNGKTTTCRLLRRILETGGKNVGMCTTDEFVINGQTLIRADCAGGPYPAMIVKNSVVEAGVFELARGALIRQGIYLDEFSVGVVTNVTADHIGVDGINSVEDMARVKRLVAETARDAAVLNADNAYCVAMASNLSAPVWWFTLDHRNALVQEHVRAGGDAVVVVPRNGIDTLLHCHGDTQTEIVAIADIPATWNGLIRVNIANAAAAAAAALAAGIAVDTVGMALRSFSTDPDDSPGRFNFHQASGITVVLDNAHNTDGLNHLADLLARLPHEGRTLCFFSTDISRTRAHYEQVASALAGRFDHYVIADLTPPEKRRHETEIADRLVDGLAKAGVPPQSIETIPEQFEGLGKILAMARTGDAVFVKVGLDSAAYWDFITGFNLSRN